MGATVTETILETASMVLVPSEYVAVAWLSITVLAVVPKATPFLL